MVVNSQNIEFAYELISVIPYANYLQSKGLLTGTVSGNDTKGLYFFSPEHKINPEIRSWHNTHKAKDIPNIDIHKPFLRKEQFLPPDYKKQYANDRFVFEKETVIICNRHNTEWGKRAINYFNVETLRKMFDMLKDEYQIIYINIEGRNELYDNAPPEHFGDFDLLKEYPEVINIHDLHSNSPDLSFNTLQLMIFANCSKFITMNGGHSVLAAYFGGENIVMSKYGNPQTREIDSNVNSFYRWYNELGCQRIVHVENETKLIDRIKIQWIDKEPVVNILVRTSSRPNYFKNCIESISNQTYKNINIFVSIDTPDYDHKKDYTVKYPVYPVFVTKKTDIEPINDNEKYGITFPYNLYLNELQEKVKEGIIIYLDDDDCFSSDKSIQFIVDEYKKGNDLIFWKVKNLDRIIPSDKNFGKAPVNCDISGIGMAFNSKFKKNAIWEPYKRGDFRVATSLFKAIKKRSFIDAILTETQNGQNCGSSKDNRFALEKDEWYITNEGKYWLGKKQFIKKQIDKGTMKQIEISEVPEYLINK